MTVNKEKESLVCRFRKGLEATRNLLARGFQGRDNASLEQVEEVLVTADVGTSVTQEIVEGLSRKARSPGLLEKEVKAAILKGLQSQERSLHVEPGRLNVIMMVGVNGVGKTTTMAKLAHRYSQEGLRPVLAAGDTFRAAAAEQLEAWAARIGVPVVRQKEGSDPAAVAFDTLRFAGARGYDLVLIDTAGRLHTKVSLMEELRKIHRVVSREVDGAPHEVLLVLDATTGQNALQQARLFLEAVGVTGIVMAKMDGTAKGGILIRIEREVGIPVKMVGMGEGLEDLLTFEPEAFVEGLFG
ncbi:MAG: signal recognition particle-docking protein FtsY [Bacillota bacterium]